MNVQIQTNQSSWTPPGWLVDDDEDPWSFEHVIDTFGTCVEKGYVKPNGTVLEEAPSKRLAPGSEYSEVEALAHNMKLIRDCWATDKGVWDLCELLAGERFKTDPFWNIWSQLDTPVKLDGNGDTDGFNVSQWKGFTGANGPHSCTGKWMKICDEYGKRQKCAAVVPYRGDRWLWDHGMSADLILHFGRLHFHPPLNLPASSPSGCAIVCLWLPKKRRAKIHDLAARALAGDTVRVPVALTRANGKPYVRDVLITTGCSAEVVDVFNLHTLFD